MFWERLTIVLNLHLNGMISAFESKLKTITSERPLQGHRIKGQVNSTIRLSLRFNSFIFSVSDFTSADSIDLADLALLMYKRPRTSGVVPYGYGVPGH